VRRDDRDPRPPPKREGPFFKHQHVRTGKTGNDAFPPDPAVHLAPVNARFCPAFRPFAVPLSNRCSRPTTAAHCDRPRRGVLPHSGHWPTPAELCKDYQPVGWPFPTNISSASSSVGLPNTNKAGNRVAREGWSGEGRYLKCRYLMSTAKCEAINPHFPIRRRKRMLTFGSLPSGAALGGQTTRTPCSALVRAALLKAGPRVRIRLPPGGSPLRTWRRRHGLREAAIDVTGV